MLFTSEDFEPVASLELDSARLSGGTVHLPVRALPVRAQGRQDAYGLQTLPRADAAPFPLVRSFVAPSVAPT